MDIQLLRTFQDQVLTQCHFMLLAASGINEAAAQREVKLIFYSIQNLLNAAANISKALWGQGGCRLAERKALRDSIGVLDTSPLRKVTMRNNFEHYDERLDKWWKESTRHGHVDFNTGPRSMISGLDDIDLFRAYDPQTTELTFWGETFNLQALINEVQRILPRVDQECNKPH